MYVFWNVALQLTFTWTVGLTCCIGHRYPSHSGKSSTGTHPLQSGCIYFTIIKGCGHNLGLFHTEAFKAIIAVRNSSTPITG